MVRRSAAPIGPSAWWAGTALNMAGVSRTLLANYLGRFVPALLAVITLPIYVRLLGIDSYGLVGFYNALQGFANFFDLGLGAAAGRALLIGRGAGEPAARARRLCLLVERAFGAIATALCVGTAALGLAAVIGGLPLLPAGAGNSGVVVLLAVLVAMRFPFSAYANIMIGLDRQVRLNILTAATEFARHAVALAAMYWLSADFTTFLLANLAVSVLALVAHRWTALGGSVALPASSVGATPELRRLVRDAGGMSLLNLGWFLIGNVDKLVLAPLLAPAAYSAYVLAYQIATALWVMVMPVYLTVYPVVTVDLAAGRRAAARALIGRYTAFLSGSLTAIAVAFVAFDRPLLALIVGPLNASAMSATVVLAFLAGYVLNGVWQMPYALAMATAHLRPILLANCAAIALLAATAALFGQDDGAAVAVTWAVVMTGYAFGLGPWLVARHLGAGAAGWWLVQAVQPALASLPPGVVLVWLATGASPMMALVAVPLAALGLVLLAMSANRQTRSLLGAAWRLVH
jgi:O-antigen/teichoic acid export membrane protein